MKKSKVMKILAVITLVVLGCAIIGLSWIATCGIIKLITMCFGLKFSWSIATGIWLVLFLLKEIFGRGKNEK